jgi:long-subunit acyl-CoA synthetase (AMP-forming)
LTVQLSAILGRLSGQNKTLTFLADNGEETVKSFRDLETDTRILIAALQRAGVAPGARVGILAPNCYAWVMWDLALIALGCVSVALPQEKPGETPQQLAERHQLVLLAIDPVWIDPVWGAADLFDMPYLVDISSPDLAADKRARSCPLPQHAPGTHSLVFSSGTTGKTKGLIISAPGTENLVGLYAGAFGVVEQERMLTFLPFANYQQRMTYYLCLYYGADFVYVPFPRMFFGIKKYQPTFIIAPPVFYEAMQNMAQVGPKPAADADPAQIQAATSARLSSLLGGKMRYMITGMAPIKRPTLDFFWQHGVELYEAFGITEAGMVAWNKPGQVRVGTVGKPAETGTVSLSDEGEVVVTRKALLSLGYFDAAQEDIQTTFIGPNSVATGDIAEFDQDGFLMIIGRKKDAIITKAGEKFHPEALEASIGTDPAVKVAVVMGGDNLPGITALLVVADCNNPDQNERIKGQIGVMNLNLPVFQQVKRVMFTDQEFTIDNGMRTKNMKLNRKAIVAAYQNHPSFNIPVPQGSKP